MLSFQCAVFSLKKIEAKSLLSRKIYVLWAPCSMPHAPRSLEQRVNKRRGFGAPKNYQGANQQKNNDDGRNKVSFVRHDEVEQLGDEGTAAHGQELGAKDEGLRGER